MSDIWDIQPITAFLIFVSDEPAEYLPTLDIYQC